MRDTSVAIPRPAPVELARLQSQFTELLRTPLEFDVGGVRADTSRYEPRLVAAIQTGPRASARVGLAVYHRQYWLRLFDVMQREFALSARLVGLPRFYVLAQAYLTRTPPRHPDLGRAADEFVGWCATHTDVVAAATNAAVAEVLPQALAVDAAWRSIWNASELPAFVPGLAEVESLPRTQLRMTPTAALIAEDWPLVALRRELARDARANEIALPARLKRRDFWLVLRTSTGIGQLRTSALQARLYTLCTIARLEDAVEQLHAACPPDERSKLPAMIRDWLELSMDLKLWVVAC